MAKKTSHNRRLISRISRELFRLPIKKDLSNKNPSSKWLKGDKYNLPADWDVEERPRLNGKLAGIVDLYFYEPDTGKQFRSLVSATKFYEVLRKWEEYLRAELHHQTSMTSSGIHEYAQTGIQSDKDETTVDSGIENPSSSVEPTGNTSLAQQSLDDLDAWYENFLANIAECSLEPLDWEIVSVDKY